MHKNKCLPQGFPGLNKFACFVSEEYNKVLVPPKEAFYVLRKPSSHLREKKLKLKHRPSLRNDIGDGWNEILKGWTTYCVQISPADISQLYSCFRDWKRCKILMQLCPKNNILRGTQPLLLVTLFVVVGCSKWGFRIAKCHMEEGKDELSVSVSWCNVK